MTIANSAERKVLAIRSRNYRSALDRIESDLKEARPQELIAEFIKIYGLQHIAYVGFNFPGRGKDLPVSAISYPEAWVDRYLEADYLKHDPVLKAGSSSILPVDWGDLDVSSRQARQVFGEARDFGIGRQGLTFPVRGRHGEKALVSITCDESSSIWQRIKAYLIRDFQLLSHHLHDAALRAEKIPNRKVRLAPREIDVLHWAALGKTSAETAIILGLGERTVRFYIEVARYKLGAVNITNAVAKAIVLNLISVTM